MKTFALLIITITLVAGCYINDSIEGNGNITTKTYNFSNFNQVK